MKNIQFTGNAMGIVIREMVRRAMVFIYNQRYEFDINNKTAYDGMSEDFFTNIDTGAQEIYENLIGECFPEVGIIGEENSLNTKSGDVYFTIDPIDGTKAYIRRQSHGVSTMVALVSGGKIISAYIGDIFTKEIYGYDPYSENVYRISDFSFFDKIDFIDKPLIKQPLLLRDHITLQEKSMCAIKNNFKKVLIEGGSVGVWIARLWKREVAAVVLEPNYSTPWDSNPVIGISQKLGYSFYKPTDAGWWQEYIPGEVSAVSFRNHSLLIMHPKDFKKLKK